MEIAGRSIVEADAHENQVVRAAEEVALAKTRLSMHDNDDGTTSGHLHAKVAATVIVTMGLDQLCWPLKVAGTDVGVDVSAEKARKLACNAGIVPAVLGGRSVPLDLGRERRLFSDAQRTMLATQYDSCAPAGCDRPFAWAELHHHPWQHGGNTDLDQAIPLCSFHHRLIHHDGYLHTITRRSGGTRRVAF